VLVEFALGDPDGLLEVLVRQLGIQDGVATLGQVGRFDAARNRLPAVEEEDFHEARRIIANHAFGPPSLKVKSFRSGRTS
jgi:hypothetical protein